MSNNALCSFGFRVFVLGGLLLVPGPASAAADPLHLWFGGTSGEGFVLDGGTFVADCFETDAALLIHSLYWATPYDVEDAVFSYAPTFGVASVRTDGALTSLWSQVAKSSGDEAETYGDIELELPTAGQYCVTLSMSSLEPEGQWFEFDENTGDLRERLDEHNVLVVQALGWCYGSIAQLESGAASCEVVDGYSTLGTYLLVELDVLDRDGDGDLAETDCDDADDAVSHSAAEVCDGVDNDCDGVVDEALQRMWYLDVDGDGYGGTVEVECSLAEAVTNDDDCDDGDPDVNPAAIEHCNHRDDDCDGDEDEDNDGVEVCNGLDDDCDGEIDEEPTDGIKWYEDRDGDGVGDSDTKQRACAWPGIGYTERHGDCDDADFFRADDCSETTCSGCSGCSEDPEFTITFCEVTAGAVFFPALVLLRRRRRGGGPGQVGAGR